MMIHAIAIAPTAGAWRLELDGNALPDAYASGAEAERAAQELADRLAAEGAPVLIEVRLADGSTAARLIGRPRDAGPVLWRAPSRALDAA